MASDSSDLPHQQQALANTSERFAARLLDALWDRYRTRVGYVAEYEQLVRRLGGTFVNDHVAFRTFACQQPYAGVSSLSRLFQTLGYRAAGTYSFEDKHLDAIHFQHANPHLPKLFISELRTWELSETSRRIIQRSTSQHRAPLSTEYLSAVSHLSETPDGVETLLSTAVAQFHERPWPAPERSDVEQLNAESQYAAWVLVHGYHVNHFTALINSHGVEALSDIEKTVAALREAGTPMKEQIEGGSGGKLRQTATKAAVIDVDVTNDSQPATMPWTYAYFELAERGEIEDAAGGKQRFEGFLGAQATNLFEMTRRDQ